MVTRRTFLEAGGFALAGLAVPGGLRATARLLTAVAEHPKSTVEIGMRSDQLGARVWFDPIGRLVALGTTVRWVLVDGVHSTTAYHPTNARPLRIPEGARPWDSGILQEPGSSLEVRLTVPGIYDFFCLPHEAAGMVGRIVVGVPGVDFEVPPYALRDIASDTKLPRAARQAFPSFERIVRERVVR